MIMQEGFWNRAAGRSSKELDGNTGRRLKSSKGTLSLSPRPLELLLLRTQRRGGAPRGEDEGQSAAESLAAHTPQ